MKWATGYKKAADAPFRYALGLYDLSPLSKSVVPMKRAMSTRYSSSDLKQYSIN